MVQWPVSELDHRKQGLKSSRVNQEVLSRQANRVLQLFFGYLVTNLFVNEGFLYMPCKTFPVDLEITLKMYNT